MNYGDMTIEAFDAVRKLEGKAWQVGFKVRVLESPAGGMSPEEAVPVVYEETALQPVLQRLEFRTIDPASLVALGRTLAAMLLPPGAEGGASVREMLKVSLAACQAAGKGLRLRLRLPPVLAPLPWEYMYVDRAGGGDGMDGFLSLDPRVAIVRHEVLGAPPALTPLAGDIKVVIALASPPNLAPLNLGQEKQIMEEALAGRAGIKPVFLEEATLGDVLGAIPNTGIFHFSGHGGFERKLTDLPGTYSGEGGIALLDGIAMAEQVGVNLRGNGVRLAVLSGCETGRRDGVSVWSGIAPALVKAEVPAVIGNQYKILDRCAIAFARLFYQALAGGLPLERAVAAGRIAAYNASKTTPDWGAPVLYLRAADGELFAGSSNPAVRSEARRGAEVDVDIRTGEVAKGGEVIGGEVRKMLGGKLAINIEVGGTVYGSVVGFKADTLTGGELDVDVHTGTVGQGGQVIGVRLDELDFTG